VPTCHAKWVSYKTGRDGEGVGGGHDRNTNGGMRDG